MEPLIAVRDLEKRIGSRLLLDGVTFGVSAGERVGLVGVNGAGKSTLLRLLVDPAADLPDDGLIARRRGLRLAYVPQEPHLPPGRTVGELLREGQAEHVAVRDRLTALEDELSTLSGARLDAALEEQMALHDRIDQLGGWDLDHEIRGLAASLAVPPADRIAETLSIGERRRVALARAFLATPELLALDEPTNHLDATTTEWLEERLRAFGGALLLVTHDRYFLDRVATRILELDRGRVQSYDGGYARFLEQRAERLGSEAKHEDQRAAFVRRELDWIRRGPSARGTKQKARIERFDAAVGERPSFEERSPEDRKMGLRLPPGPRLGGTVLELRDLGVERGGRWLFRHLDLTMKAGDRIGIVGPNGAGKTTLVRTLLDQMKPSEGTVKAGVNTKFTFLDQTRSDLNPDDTVIQAVAAENDQVFLEDGPVHVRTFLRMMLLDDRVTASRVGDLSGGERNRVQLTRLLREGGNFIVLDEPTNDLDLMTLSVLEEALADFKGCALVVSHDRWFLDRVATGILAFEGQGQVVFHEGNYSQYRDRQARANQAAASAAKAAPAAARAAGAASAPQASAGGGKALSYKEKQELAGMEAAIEAAEARVSVLERTLSAPDLYKSRAGDVPNLYAKLETAKAEVARLYARWDALLARG